MRGKWFDFTGPGAFEVSRRLGGKAFVPVDQPSRWARFWRWVFELASFQVADAGWDRAWILMLGLLVIWMGLGVLFLRNLKSSGTLKREHRTDGGTRK